MNKIFYSLLCLGFVLSPLALAQDEDGASTPDTKLTTKNPAAKKAAATLKKAQNAKKQFDAGVKKRDKVKIKWVSSDKKAFKEAEKYNLPVVVLFSNPATCPYCVKLDNEILSSKEFKKATGAFIGYRSTTPLPQYGLTQGMPSGCIYAPDGKQQLGKFGYTPGKSADSYLSDFKAAGDKVLQAAEQKITAELDKAQAEFDAATESTGDSASEE